MYSEDPAWKQLISPTFTTDGRVSLITTIFLDHNQVEMVEHLSGDDAQTFIDITDEVSPHTTSRTGDGSVDFDSNLHISRLGVE